jgi:hypothetical protein
MIEIALLLGLGTVGYLLANDQAQPREPETMEPYENKHQEQPRQIFHDDVAHSQASSGHNNEVPFFGANQTQAMYSGATSEILDNHTGAGHEYFQKKEVRSFYDAKPGSGKPFGNSNESEFMQSRMVSGQNMKNTFPIDQVRVGAGSNDGFTNIPNGGFQQDQLREYALPKTTDETRVLSKPKLSFEPPMIMGSAYVTVPGIQADVKKNKPEKFAIYGMDRVNTAVGAQTAPRIYSEQPVKPQARDTTEKQHFGPGGGMSGVMKNYVRAFTEPFQEFMKLTAEGRPGPAGGGVAGLAIGADSYSAHNNKDDSVLAAASRFNPGTIAINASVEDLGSYRYNEPLQQNIEVERMDGDILKAFKQNPYSQNLNAF